MRAETITLFANGLWSYAQEDRPEKPGPRLSGRRDDVRRQTRRATPRGTLASPVALFVPLGSFGDAPRHSAGNGTCCEVCR